MPDRVTTIPMGKHFTFKQLLDKLEELGLDDLFSSRGAPLTSTCCGGATGVKIHHESGWIEDGASIIWFDEYDWVSNPTNVEYTIFDFYRKCMYNLTGYPDYVCVDESKKLATKIVLVHTDTHKYAHVA